MPFNYLFQPLVEILRNLLPGMDPIRLPTVVLTDEVGIKHEIYSDETLSSAVSAAINNKYGHWYRLWIICVLIENITDCCQMKSASFFCGLNEIEYILYLF